MFTDRNLGDTVYVTANPYSTEIAPDSFHEIIDVSRDSWDSGLGTVPADKVADAAVDALHSYPNKRLLVHLLQPHTPFVESNLPADVIESPFEAIITGRIAREPVEQAYLDNLSYVFDYVESLIEQLPNRTVVSADHGEMLGEGAWPVPIRCYGHIPGIRTPELNDVPGPSWTENREKSPMRGPHSSRQIRMVASQPVSNLLGTDNSGEFYSVIKHGEVTNQKSIRYVTVLSIEV